MELILLSSMDGTHTCKAISGLKARLLQARFNPDKTCGGVNSARLTAGYVASQPDPRGDYYQPIQEWYARQGIEMNLYVELEQGSDVDAADALFECDLIHLSGGDTYRFLYWLKQRGLLPRLKAFAEAGGGLVGLSAGAMILSPSIASARVCGDSNEIGLRDLSGVGLIDFSLVPHLPHGNHQDWLHQASQFRPVVLLHDDDVLVLQGEEWLSFGSPVWQVNESSSL